MPSKRLLLKKIQSLCERSFSYQKDTRSTRVKNLQQELQQHFKEYKEMIEEELAKDDNAELEDEYLTTDDKVSSAMEHLLDLQEDPNFDSNSTQSTSITELMHVQKELLSMLADNHRRPASTNHALPKIHLPPFSGKINDWVSFRDVFVSTIDENEDLSNIQKFQFLRNSVTGDAASMIKTIPMSSTNYSIAWKTLMTTFNRECVVVDSILNRFFNCQKVSPTLNNLKDIFNTFRETFEMLDNQGEYARSRDPLAIFFMVQKLDSETLLAWVRHSKRMDEPSINEFLTFLQDHTSITERRAQVVCKPPVSIPSKNQKSFGVNKITNYSCFYCGEPHSVYKCSKFLGLNVNAREKVFTSQLRCLKCLSKNHSLKNCASTQTCGQCNQNHNTLLHRDTREIGNSSIQAENCKSLNSSNFVPQDLSTSNSNVIQTIGLNKIHSICSSSAILPTAIIKVHTANGDYLSARALLDSGAQTTVISDALASQLGLRRSRNSTPLWCLADTAQIKSRGKIDFTFSSRVEDSMFTTSAIILPRLAGHLPQVDIPITRLHELQSQFKLADPTFSTPSKIDVILAAPFLFAILKPTLYFHEIDKIYIQDSKLGSLVCSTSEFSSEVSVNSIKVEPSSYEDSLLQKFWELEEVSPLRNSFSENNDVCESFFTSTTTRLPTGRFCVRLPFKTPLIKLGNSYEISAKRFRYLENKFHKNPQFRDEYVKFMSDYEESGHMIATNLNFSTLPSSHYVIPHHGIVQTGSAGKKLRVVFDASSKTSSEHSLNDVIHCGPRLQTDIIDIIHYFRSYRYVFISDIEKMYRQILIHEHDQNYQMILWRSSPSQRIKIYKLTTVTYGEAASPFLALRTLQELAERENLKFPDAAQILVKRRYVDDIFCGSDTIDQLKRLKSDLISLLDLGGFKLKKWASNSSEILENIERIDLANPMLFSEESTPSIKTLGISWNPKSDTFSYVFTPPIITNWSKRSLLSDTAKLFDPMGWVSPLIVSYKILFQETWIQKVDWDAPLPENIKDQWKCLREDLSNVREIQIPRFFGTKNIEIHGFSDASKAAYAAVLYARFTTRDGEVCTRLIISKTKLAPIKVISIPRLELCAAHLLAKLVNKTVPKLNEVSGIYLWSDSTTVLAWLKSLPRKWSSFVSNRVGQIHELCENASWHYVKSRDNPADIASRGANATQLIKASLWWNGPKFLVSSDFCFQQSSDYQTTEELAMPRMHNILSPKDEFIISFLTRFSNVHRLIHSMCYILRVQQRVKKALAVPTLMLSAEEYKSAKLFIIKRIQSFYFASELSRLTHNQSVKQNSPLIRLTPFLDSDGVIRVGGRLHNAKYHFDTIHPIILPKCHFSDLIISRTHLSTYHGGLTLMCAEIRKEYWILQLQRSVKSHIHACSRCRRYRAKTYQPIMGNLPKERVSEAKPFSNTGIDFAGPILLRPSVGRGKTTMKGFLAVLVCLATKAVHLELVMSLSSTSLLMALRRFVARRGHCHQFFSDNGRNFVAADRALKEYHDALQHSTNSPELLEYLTNHSITWKFIPRYSPHFGGIWESVVKSVKRHLYRTFNGSTLSIEELQTSLCQIESILNSRPLTPISREEPYQPLTPFQLLTGDASAYLSDELGLSNLDSSTRCRQKMIQGLIKQFWSRWRNEYIITLTSKTKWVKGSVEIKVGDIVLIKNAFDPPRSWRFGKVTKLYPGRDDISRVVDVLTANGTHRESVRRLIPILVD